jgi:hypothetical protein
MNNILVNDFKNPGRSLKFDFIILVILLIISPFFIFHYNFSFFFSSLVYFLLPSLYLLFRKPHQIKEALAGSILLGLVLGTWFDIYAEFNDAWVWPKPNEFFFNFYFLNLVPLDVIVWLVLWVFYIIVFYEHFFKHKHTGGLSPRYFRSLVVATIVLLISSTLYFFYPAALNLPYTYFILGFIAFILSIFFIFHERALIKSFILTGFYFFVLYVIFEFTSLSLGHWAFPGKYVATILFFNFTIPFEEFFFWIMLSSPILLSFYEFLVDDIKLKNYAK